MLTDPTPPAPIATYAALLADARIAALHALTDILKTSDDPNEKRLAAAAILRIPEPPAQQPHAPAPQSDSVGSYNNPVPPHAPATDLDPTDPADFAARIRSALARANIPLAEDDDPFDHLATMRGREALDVIRAAGRASPT